MTVVCEGEHEREREQNEGVVLIVCKKYMYTPWSGWSVTAGCFNSHCQNRKRVAALLMGYTPWGCVWVCGGRGVCESVHACDVIVVNIVYYAKQAMRQHYVYIHKCSVMHNFTSLPRTHTHAHTHTHTHTHTLTWGIPPVVLFGYAAFVSGQRNQWSVCYHQPEPGCMRWEGRGEGGGGRWERGGEKGKEEKGKEGDERGEEKRGGEGWGYVTILFCIQSRVTQESNAIQCDVTQG